MRVKVTISKMNGGTADGISPSFKYNPYQELSAMLPKWKSLPELAFLAIAPSKSLQITLETRIRRLTMYNVL